MNFKFIVFKANMLYTDDLVLYLLFSISRTWKDVVSYAIEHRHVAFLKQLSSLRKA